MRLLGIKRPTSDWHQTPVRMADDVGNTSYPSYCCTALPLLCRANLKPDMAFMASRHSGLFFRDFGARSSEVGRRQWIAVHSVPGYQPWKISFEYEYRGEKKKLWYAPIVVPRYLVDRTLVIGMIFAEGD